MSKHHNTLAELFDTLDRLEKGFDRSTQAIENCIQHLDKIEQQVQRPPPRPPAHTRPPRLPERVRRTFWPKDE